MIDPRLRLRHLRCFLEIGRLGSLCAAAEALHVSQPAVSKTVRELEEILSVSLFDRSGRQLALTRAGRTYQQYVGSVMVDLRRAHALIQESPQQKIRLKIGALPTASTDLMPNAALGLMATRPDCLICVTTGPNAMLMSQLRDGELDMVVGRLAPEQSMNSLTFLQLYSEQVIPVVRAEHPLIRDGWSDTVLTDSAFRQYPLMLPPADAVIYPIVRAYLYNHGISDPDPMFENVSLAFGRSVVQRSDTVWFISKGVVLNELEAGTLVALPLQDELLGGPVGVSLRENTVMSPELQALIAALINSVPSIGNSKVQS